MRTTPEGLIGSMFELNGYGRGSLPIVNSLWIVVAAWKGDGRGRRGRKGMWRVTLAPISDANNHPMFQALWNDRGRFLEAHDDNNNWLMSRQVR